MEEDREIANSSGRIRHEYFLLHLHNKTMLRTTPRHMCTAYTFQVKNANKNTPMRSAQNYQQQQ